MSRCAIRPREAQCSRSQRAGDNRAEHGDETADAQRGASDRCGQAGHDRRPDAPAREVSPAARRARRVVDRDWRPASRRVESTSLPFAVNVLSPRGDSCGRSSRGSRAEQSVAGLSKRTHPFVYGSKAEVNPCGTADVRRSGSIRNEGRAGVCDPLSLPAVPTDYTRRSCVAVRSRGRWGRAIGRAQVLRSRRRQRNKVRSGFLSALR